MIDYTELLDFLHTDILEVLVREHKKAKRWPCHITLYSRAITSIVDLIRSVKEQQTEIERLRALLKPLPKLGCGAPARPEMEIWYLSKTTPGEIHGPWTLRVFNAHGNGYVNQHHGTMMWRELARMFSTRPNSPRRKRRRRSLMPGKRHRRASASWAEDKQVAEETEEGTIAKGEVSMRIEASVGKAPRSASLTEQVYKLTLTANNQGELQWLAGLFRAVKQVAPRIVLRERVPHLHIDEVK